MNLLEHGGLIDRIIRKLFIRFCARIGVSQLGCSGISGEVIGYVVDRGVFYRYFVDGVWSKDIITVFQDYLSQTDSASYLDIGANIGLTTIPIAKNRGVRCFAFEPEPRNYRLLQFNLLQNGVSENVTSYNLALSDRKGDLSFELSADNYGDHRLGLESELAGEAGLSNSTRSMIHVASDTLDNVMPGELLSFPVAIKIDTQGAEYQIYKGGRSIFRVADLVVMEYWPYGIRRLGGDPIGLLDMLEDDFQHVSLLWRESTSSAIDRIRRFDAVRDSLERMCAKSHEKPETQVDILLVKEAALSKLQRRL